MRKHTPKQAAVFKSKAIKALVALGAFPCGGMYEHRLETKHGLLCLSVCDNAIRTRFDNVPPCNPAGAPLNPYSGKWNFEFSAKPTDEELDTAIRQIRGVLS
jgi:hypothetical protein